MNLAVNLKFSKIRNVYKILIGKCEGKRPLGIGGRIILK
jgi:hypothetical protein